MHRTSRPKSSNHPQHERRRERRHDSSKAPDLAARLVGGSGVKLVNVSRRGVLLETNISLKPGRSVSVRFVALDANLVLSGSVVRSSVGALTSSSIAYRAALSFGADNTLCVELFDASDSDAHDSSRVVLADERMLVGAAGFAPTPTLDDLLPERLDASVEFELDVAADGTQDSDLSAVTLVVVDRGIASLRGQRVA